MGERSILFLFISVVFIHFQRHLYIFIEISMEERSSLFLFLSLILINFQRHLYIFIEISIGERSIFFFLCLWYLSIFFGTSIFLFRCLQKRGAVCFFLFLWYLSIFSNTSIFFRSLWETGAFFSFYVYGIFQFLAAPLYFYLDLYGERNSLFLSVSLVFINFQRHLYIFRSLWKRGTVCFFLCPWYLSIFQHPLFPSIF